MKRLICTIMILLFTTIILFSCGNRKTDVLTAGDVFSITGIVEYSDEPSDIGNEYCSVTGSVKKEYLYIDIYGQESKWSSDIFFTQGKDTVLLKDYVGQKVTVSGELAAESHGIPYITNITVK